MFGERRERGVLEQVSFQSFDSVQSWIEALWLSITTGGVKLTPIILSSNSFKFQQTLFNLAFTKELIWMVR